MEDINLKDAMKQYEEDCKKCQLTKEQRKDLFEEYRQLSYDIRKLSWIVQKPMEISGDMIEEQYIITETVCEKLNMLVDTINGLVKSQN